MAVTVWYERNGFLYKDEYTACNTFFVHASSGVLIVGVEPIQMMGNEPGNPVEWVRGMAAFAPGLWHSVAVDQAGLYYKRRGIGPQEEHKS